MVRPLIGLTTYMDVARYGANERYAAVLPMAYVRAVHRSGGRAVLITPDDPGVDVLDHLDGLILTGGSDVDPVRYGEEAHPETALKPGRDEAEFLLLRAALARNVPVLAICRGFEVLAIEYGGRLHQHLPDLFGHSRHRPGTGPRFETPNGPRYGEHTIRLEPGTRVHKILGDEVVVNSWHHQGVTDPGRLTAAGWDTDDNLLEAVEDPARRFVVGVQWHAEDVGDPRLFDALIESTQP